MFQASIFNQGLSYIDIKCYFSFRLLQSKYNWLFHHTTNEKFFSTSLRQSNYF